MIYLLIDQLIVPEVRIPLEKGAGGDQDTIKLLQLLHRHLALINQLILMLELQLAVCADPKQQVSFSRKL